jgi:hypothetical protein
VPLRFSPRTTALKVPVFEKKVPLPKGLPFLFEAPAWRSVAKMETMRVASAMVKTREERILFILLMR